MDQFLYRTMLENAPDPRVDAAFSPASLSLQPGASETVTLGLSDKRSTVAKTVTWKLDVPDGVTASPAEGTATVPAGGSASATVTLTAGTTGVHSVVLSGDGVLDRALPVQVTDNAGTFRALTANFSGASVSSIDLSTGRSTDIAVGNNPGEVVVSADGRTAYAADQGSNTVSVIDVAEHTVTATVAVGRVPAGLALTPDGGTSGSPTTPTARSSPWTRSPGPRAPASRSAGPPSTWVWTGAAARRTSPRPTGTRWCRSTPRRAPRARL
ncbi:YncE family protein [Streptomyces sp. NPDC050997]|uniref:YncE family protein n=1 Tax=Streptomyces sp. NPDC050997 TaxID=3155519 RepID=UPI0034241C5D